MRKLTQDQTKLVKDTLAAVTSTILERKFSPSYAEACTVMEEIAAALPNMTEETSKKISEDFEKKMLTSETVLIEY